MNAYECPSNFGLAQKYIQAMLTADIGLGPIFLALYPHVAERNAAAAKAEELEEDWVALEAALEWFTEERLKESGVPEVVELIEERQKQSEEEGFYISEN